LPSVYPLQPMQPPPFQQQASGPKLTSAMAASVPTSSSKVALALARGELKALPAPLVVKAAPEAG
jgi:hypothetical protein